MTHQLKKTTTQSAAGRLNGAVAISMNADSAALSAGGLTQAHDQA